MINHKNQRFTKHESFLCRLILFSNKISKQIKNKSTFKSSQPQLKIYWFF